MKLKKGLKYPNRKRPEPFTEEHKRNIGLGRLGHEVFQKTRDKISIANNGKKNGMWRGEDATFSSKHCWIRENYGNPPYCEDCGKAGELTGKIRLTWDIHWSNCDHKYRRVREDYTGRCRKCHIKYDFEYNNLYEKRYGKRNKW